MKAESLKPVGRGVVALGLRGWARVRFRFGRRAIATEGTEVHRRSERGKPDFVWGWGRRRAMSPRDGCGRRALVAAVVACACGGAAQGQCADGGHWVEAGPENSVPGVDGVVYASAVFDPDGEGPRGEELIVAGIFGVAGDVRVHNVAAWDGEKWRAMRTSEVMGEGQYVGTLGVHNGALYLGVIEYYEGLRDSLFVWNGREWESATPMFAGDVTAIASFGGELVVGGRRAVERAASQYGVFVLRDGAWQRIGEQFRCPLYGAYLNSLLVKDDRLYVAGWFGCSGSVAVQGVARWDGTAWGPVGSDFNLSMQPWVSKLVTYQDELVAMGKFTLASGSYARNIARWDGSAWWPVGQGTEIGLRVSDGAVTGDINPLDGRLYVTGPISVRGASRTHLGLAWWDGAEWNGFVPASGPVTAGAFSGTPYTISAYDGGVVVGGELSSSDATPDGVGLMAFAGSDARSLGSGWKKSVQSLAVWGGGIAITSQWRAGIWNWNGATLNALATDQMRAPGAPLGVFQGSLVIGGLGGLRVWRDPDWVMLEGPTTGFADFVGTYQGKIVCSASRDAASPEYSVYLREGAEWRELAGVFSSSIGKAAQFNDELVVAGYFTAIDGAPVNQIARWDGASWLPLGEGCVGTVRALVVTDGKLVAAGDLTRAGDLSVRNVAQWDGQAWAQMGNGLQARVTGLARWNGRLLAASGYGVYQFDGKYWVPFGPAANGTIYAMAVSGDELLIGGNFSRIGEMPAGRWARFVPGCCGTLDFNMDGVWPDVADVEAFVSAFAGAACERCRSLDFNNDGVWPDMADLGAYLRVWAGGECEW